jgi:hypothetical protein
VSNNHVIELNGNKYDALTGKIITGSVPSSRPDSTASTNKTIAKQSAHTSKAASTNHVSKVHRTTTRSSTLMRSAVKKPTVNPVHNVTAYRARPKQVQVSKSQKVVTSPAMGSIDPLRVARANHVPKNGLVSKFGHGSSQTVTLADVPVQSAPKQQAQASRRAANHAKSAASHRTENPFESALHAATSHEQPRLRKLRLHDRIARKLHIAPRTLLMSTGLLSVLAIGGFLAYTRVPSVAMKVAATKAGIHATLPTYQPAGFSLKGPIASAPGEISVNYKSNSDDRDFKLVQKTSSWNSETLLDNFVETSKQASYQTFQTRGRTIYIYDGGNATWVDGGIWYKIEGNTSLNSDQLLRIANSL